MLFLFKLARKQLLPGLLVCQSIFPCLLPAQTVQRWWSSELHPQSVRWFTDPPDTTEIRYRLARQPDLGFTQQQANQPVNITIFPDCTFQTLTGIGTSLEATTIYAIRKNKSRVQRLALLKQLVDPANGLGFSLFRITIGTSDFSDGRAVSNHPQGYYSYQDNPGQPFSIQQDLDLNIPQTIRELIEVANQLDPPQPLRIFASCWSPPGWMKTSGTLIGGSLKPGFAPQLAAYFRQFIEAYGSEGIPISAVTLQNEPNFVPDSYPGMRLSAEQEQQLALALHAEFSDSSQGKQPLDVAIWINDHNFEYWAKADTVLTALQRENQKHVVSGVAFHNYSEAPASNMQRLQQKHPHISLHLTEHSEWGAGGMFNIQQYFQNGAQSWLNWVTMTTQDPGEHNQGPYNRIGELSPTLLMQRHGSSPEWYVTPEYFLVAQFSRYLRPGAMRIACSEGSPESVSAVAFRNPDGSIVLILVNQLVRSQPFAVHSRQMAFNDVLPGKSVGTYIWHD